MTPRALLLMSKPQRPPASILSLFAGGESGGIWLPSFAKSMFSDSGMTAVAQIGDPVVKMVDLSGRGNTITFSNVTLRQSAAGLRYLVANGTSSSGVTASIDFTGTSKACVFAGVTKLSDAAAGVITELSANGSTTAGTFSLQGPTGANDRFAMFGGGTIWASSFAAGNAAPKTAVLTGQMDITAPLISLRVNGVAATPSSATEGTGTMGNQPLYFFGRGGAGNRFNGNWFGQIVRGAACSAGQIADVEAYLNTLTGAY